ncbi:MAG: hypothetical protein EZS28_046896, partial [Streblomastix strix]
SYPEKCICNQDYSPVGCRCAQGEYLTGLPNTTCPCVEGDVRAGTGVCPSLCTIQQHPQDCTCPIDDEQFTLEQCRATKTCTSGNNPQNYRPLGCSIGQCTAADQNYGCICTTAFHPPGCTCPTVLEELQVLEISMCPCVEKDKRNLCPADCTSSNYETNDCLCNSDDQSYDLEVCRKAKICSAQNIPQGCTPTCQAGQFPETHNCVCAGSDLDAMKLVVHLHNHRIVFAYLVLIKLDVPVLKNLTHNLALVGISKMLTYQLSNVMHQKSAHSQIGLQDVQIIAQLILI